MLCSSFFLSFFQNTRLTFFQGTSWKWRRVLESYHQQNRILESYHHPWHRITFTTCIINPALQFSNWIKKFKNALWVISFLTFENAIGIWVISFLTFENAIIQFEGGWFSTSYDVIVRWFADFDALCCDIMSEFSSNKSRNSLDSRGEAPRKGRDRVTFDMGSTRGRRALMRLTLSRGRGQNLWKSGRAGE